MQQTEVSNAAIRRYDCPQCGAPVAFRSSIAISAVCEHCRSVVVRRDFNVETFGSIGELPPDLSPLQIGTQGYFQGKQFTLIGRVRLHWKDGSWTEWCADFGGGTMGWLAEAMGFFMVSFAHTVTEMNRTWENRPTVGTRLTLGGETWLVNDVKAAHYLGAEGGLPFAITPNMERLSADLTGAHGQFGTLEFEADGTRFFTGEYAQFDDLHFSNLRPVPGWAFDAQITRHHSQALNCPQCGAVVNLRAEGLSMSAVCGSCGTILDSSRPLLREVGRVAQTTLRLNPVLPIGKRAMLREHPWEVIGFMRRKDRWCSWDEYLLFNPWLGFRFLVTYNGHWTLVRLLPGHHTNEVYEGRRFRLFAREEAKATDVLGEFYWRVKTGERAQLSDYVDPPRILSKEYSEDLNEITWSVGEYIPHAEVGKAFGVALREPSGVYLNQPNPHQDRWHQIRTPFIFAALAYALIQIVTLGFGTQTAVLNTGLTYQPGQAGGTLVTERFKLNAGSAPLEVTSYANILGDNYLALKGALVNARTQETVPLSLPMTGYNSAVSSRHTVTLPAVSGGEYYFRFTPDASATLGPTGINLSAKRGGIFWSNFFFGLLPLLAWPLWLMGRSASFEKQRWMESEYG